MVDIKHIHLLDAIRVTGSLSGAARRLGYSQPAVSQQLGAVERKLKVALVVRSSTGVRLTATGWRVLEVGRPAVQALEDAVNEIVSMAELNSGHVRLAGFPSAAATLIPKALGQLKRRYKGLAFSLSEVRPTHAIKLLEEAKCEVAVTYQYVDEQNTVVHSTNISEKNLVTIPLLVEDILVALPPDHPLSSDSVIDLHSLANDNWISGCVECTDNLIKTCALAGFKPEIAFETDDYVALQHLVANGLGVALIPELMYFAAKLYGYSITRAQTRRRVVMAVTTQQMARLPNVGGTINALKQAASHFDQLKTIKISESRD